MLLRDFVDLLRPSVHGLRPHCSRRSVIMPAVLPTLQRSPMPRQRLSSTAFMDMNCKWVSVGLDIGRPDYFAPSFREFSNELAKVGGRIDKRSADQVGEPRLHFWIGKRGIDLPRLASPTWRQSPSSLGLGLGF